VTAVCAVLALVGLAACGSDDDSSDDTTADAAADGDTSLDGRAFVSTSVEGQDLVEGSKIAITFDDGSLAMYAGCNNAVGAYTLTDGTLTVGPMAQTRMACEDALMAQDTWILAMLEAGPTVTSDGENITIEGSGTTIELAADNGENAANPLDGSRWRFETLTVDGKMTAAAEGASLAFHDYSVEVFTGCNLGSGGVEVTESKITFGPIAITLMACEGAAGEFEAALLPVLTGEFDYVIEGQTLTLTSGKTEIILATTQ
jgi:heat shock protein HslJ